MIDTSIVFVCIFQFIYAFNICPMKLMEQAELTRQPQDVTECPYNLDKSFREAKKEKSSQFFYDQKMIDNPKAGQKRQHGKGGGPHEKKKPGIED